MPASLAALGAGVHGDADVGLGECGSVIGAVSGHRHQLALCLLGVDQTHLRLRRRLGQKVVYAGLAAMAAAVSGLSPVIITVRIPIARKRSKRSLNAAFDHVLEVNDPEARDRSRPTPRVVFRRCQSHGSTASNLGRDRPARP